MKRTDIHRPSVIDPTAYEFVAFEQVKIEGLGDCYYIMAQRERIKNHMKQTGGNYSGHAHGGNCMICGNANAIYTALFYHTESNKYVRAGQDCADKLHLSSGDWNEFRRSISNAIHARAGKKKAQQLLALAGIEAAWKVYEAQPEPCNCDWPNRDMGYHAPICASVFAKEEVTIRDIVATVVKYGNLSDNKANYIGILLSNITNRPAILAARAAEKAAAAPCPTGRVVVTGTVLKAEERDTDFGRVVKLLVKDDSGFMVWGTRPAHTGVDRGDRLTFSAAVEPSQNDPKFGFYKRPTQAEVLKKEETANETV